MTVQLAHAACPERADLTGNGIWVSSSDTSITHFKATGPDTISEQTMYGADGYWLESYKGIYIIRDVTVSNSERDPSSETATLYQTPLSELPIAVPGESWSGPITYKGSSGETHQTLSVNFGPAQTTTIGDCSYQSVPADSVFRDPDGGGSTGRILYLTDLGISVLVASGEPGSLYAEFYSILAISNEPIE